MIYNLTDYQGLYVISFSNMITYLFPPMPEKTRNKIIKIIESGKNIPPGLLLNGVLSKPLMMGGYW